MSGGNGGGPTAPRGDPTPVSRRVVRATTYLLVSVVSFLVGALTPLVPWLAVIALSTGAVTFVAGVLYLVAASRERRRLRRRLGLRP